MNAQSAVDESEFGEIDELLDRLATQYRKGERVLLPPEVAARPALARRVMQLLNTMLAMEGLATPFPELKRKATRQHGTVTEVGGYRIVREIGRGGMGVVYEAEQSALRRRVALKVLPDYAANDPVAIERFQREARAVARLHHTNIVPIFDVGREGDRSYFAMQLISGCGLDRLIDLRRRHDAGRQSGGVGATLPAALADPSNRDSRSASRDRTNELLRREPSDTLDAPGTTAESRLEPRTIVVAPNWLRAAGPDFFRAAARAGAEAASALEHAHSRGVIHRDVKPSNLLVDEAGAVWVTDFGLAKIDGGDITRSNAIIGTVRYLAPERFGGRGDARSDVYSLGATLYELILRRAAYDQLDQVELIHAISKIDPPRPRVVDPAVPRDLETVLLKAIERDPERRYQSAAELRHDLERFAADEPIVARRASIGERLARWCRKNPSLAALTAAVATLLIAFAGYFSISNRRLERALGVSQELRKDAEAGKLGLERELEVSRKLKLAETAAKVEATERLRDAHIERARAIRRGVDVGRRHESLLAIEKAAAIRVDEKLRDEAIASMVHLDLRAIQQPPIALRETRGIEACPTAFDGALYRYAVFQPAGIDIKRASDRQTIVQLPHPIRERFWDAWCQFSPSGERLLVGYGLNANQLDSALFDLSSGQLIALFRNANCAWLPNGAVLLCRWPQGDLQRVDPTTGSVAWQAPWKITRGGEFNPSGDGSLLAVWSRYSDVVEIRRLVDGSAIAKFQNDALSTGVGWSPDGALLVAAQANFESIVWNVASKRRQTTLVGHLSGPSRIAFHPNGSVLATSAWGESTKFWNPFDGRLLLSIPDSLERFSEDGDRVAMRKDKQATLWELAAGDVEVAPKLEPLTKNFGGPQADRINVDFSPNEDLFACIQPGGVRVFSCRNFQAVAFLPCPSVESLAFDDLGRNLCLFTARAACRWPIKAIAGGGKILYRFGPPDITVHPQPIWANYMALAPNRLQFAAPDPQTRDTTIISLSNLRKRKPLGPMSRVKNAALSADGRWLATSGWRSNRVQAWDIASGKLLATLFANPEEGGNVAGLAFSPDGKHLLTQGFKLIHWETKSWKQDPQKPHVSTSVFDVAPAFAPSGDLLAVAMSAQEIALFDPSSMTRLASLTPRDPASLQSLRFSDTGAFLATTTYDHRVRVWNIGELRRRLAAMGLDWKNARSLEGSAAPSSSRHPDDDLTAEVFGTAFMDVRIFAYWRLALSWLYDLRNLGSDASSHVERARAYRLLGWRAAESREWQRTIDIDPGHIVARQARATQAFDCRDYAGAKRELDNALKSQPDNCEVLAQRGRACERLQLWSLAADDYQRAMAINPGDGQTRLRRNVAFTFSGRSNAAAKDFAATHHAYFYDEVFFSHWMRALVRTRDVAAIERTIPRLVGFGNEPGVVENNLAWTLVSGPRGTQLPHLALPLIMKSIELRPTDAYAYNTLGHVLMRLGRDTEAIAAIEKRRQIGKDERTAFDAMVHAFCSIRRSNLVDAIAHLRFAKEFRDRRMIARWSPEDVAELNEQIAEAEELIGQHKQAKPKS